MTRRSLEGHRRRVSKLKARIAVPPEGYMPRCTVPDPITGKACGRPTARAAKQGLSAFTCRFHQQKLQRFGSTWCKSPSASDLKPYLTAALAFIDLHRTRDAFIRAALEGLAGLMASAGPTEIVTRLRGKPPKERARLALARMRDRSVKPERLLAIPLAVAALIEEAPATVHRTREWRIVAIAKASHRLASGYHKTWEKADREGHPKRIEMHAYPRSAGRVLRYLGEMIENECELVIDRHLAAVLALKLKRYGPHLSKLAAMSA